MATYLDIVTTLGALAAAAPALARLAAQPLPIATAYQVAKLAKVAQGEIDLFVERRNALIREYGEERDATPADGGPGGRVLQVTPQHVEAYTARVNELGALPVTLAVAPITLAALEALVISPADVLALGPLLSDPA